MIQYNGFSVLQYWLYELKNYENHPQALYNMLPNGCMVQKKEWNEVQYSAGIRVQVSTQSLERVIHFPATLSFLNYCKLLQK